MERRQIQIAPIVAFAGVLGLLVGITHGTVHTALVWILAVVAVVLLVDLVISYWPRPTPVVSKPRLVFLEPSVEQRVLMSNVSVPTTGIGPQQLEDWLQREQELTPSFGASIYRVKNVPVVGDDGALPPALNVHARFRFVTEAGGVLAPKVYGRWAHRLGRDAFVEAAATQTRSTTDLQPNVLRKLDVALKYTSDPQCYAWNDETPFKRKDLRGIALGEGPVIVRVDLEGSGITATATYRLTHNGVGPEPPALHRID